MSSVAFGRRFTTKDGPQNVRPEGFASNLPFRRPLNKRALLGRDGPQAFEPLVDGGGGDLKNVGHAGLAADRLAGGLERSARDRLLHTQAILKQHFRISQPLPSMVTDAHILGMPKDAKELAKLLNEAMGNDRGVNAKVAKACGVSIQAVGQWRKNGRVAKKHLPTIAGLLGKPLAYFFPNAGKQSPPHASEGVTTTQPQQEMEQRLLMYFRALDPERKQAMLQNANAIYQEQYQGHPQPTPSFPAQVASIAPKHKKTG
jgi:transcriptional regulator with XRE-family HTH domain